MIQKILCLCLGLVFMAGSPWARANETQKKLGLLEKKISAYQVHPAFSDDRYGLLVVKAALQSLKEGSGGIGACLVDSTSGRVVEYGRNRQFSPHFRSDLHGEMDLLNRYEDRVKKTTSPLDGQDPRACKNLVLVTSVEPCPMCLTRIINSGIKTVLYVVADEEGGMATRIDHLPPFWREFAADREFKQADCAPELRQIAHDLFHFSNRSFAKNRKKEAKK